MKLTKKHLFIAIALFALFAVGLGDAVAQTTPSSGGDLSGIANRASGHGNAVINFLRVMAIVCGIGLIIGGIFALVKDAKSQGNGPVSKGAAAIMIVCGGVLTYVTSLVDSTGQSVWGQQGGSRAKIEIEQ